MDGRFLDAFTLLPRQRVVCGRVTKPLSLRHRIVLTAIKSPFVDASKLPTPSDVIIFSKIVSSHDMNEMMTQEPDKNDIEWAARMIEDLSELGNQVGECMGCIEDQAKWPVFWEGRKSSKSNGVPWVLSVVCNLVKNGVPLEDAWTMPESQAIWMSTTFSILNGSEISVVSDEDRKAMEMLREIEKAMSSPDAPKPVHPRSLRAKNKTK